MINELQYITQGKTSEEHLSNLEKACVSGAKWVQLRLKNVALEIILETAKRAREITNKYQTKLIINDYYKIAKEVKADGLHLGKNDECPLNARAFLGDSYIIGGTANTLKDCEVLIEKKVDYIGLGPFQFTETKKNLSPVLGLEGYKSINSSLNGSIPIIAIGGISLKNVPDIIKTGVFGIAISQEITNDFNRISHFYEIIKSSKQERLVNQ